MNSKARLSCIIAEILKRIAWIVHDDLQIDCFLICLNLRLYRSQDQAVIGYLCILKGTVSRDIDGYFRVYKIKSVLSAGPPMDFTFFLPWSARDI